MSDKWKKHILLENPEYFDFGNGLWTGKKPPFKTVTVIRNTNFTDSGKIDYSNVAVLEVEKKQFDQRKLIKGDIVIERSGGGPKQPVGRVVYFDKDDGDFSFSNFTSRIRVINDELDTIFVFYFLMYFYEAGNTFEMQAQTTGIRNLDFTKYKNSVRVPLIPLPEQRKIAYVLSTVQKAIEKQDKLIRHTTELKKALMQKLFTEGTKGEKQKQTEIGLVPESWEEIIIGDLGKCVTGTTPKTAVEEYWNSNDFDFIAPADIGNTKYVYNSAKMMSNEGLKVSRILPKNSVLCVCIGSSIGKVGLTFKDQSATNQQINSIICKAEYNPIYTYYLLVQYAEHWRGHATFGPVPILNKGQFELIKIFVTKDKQEQSLIAESLQTFDSKIEFHGKKKQSLYNLFKTLLHELMTGERRVHEIEFEALTKAYKIKEQPLSMAAEK